MENKLAVACQMNWVNWIKRLAFVSLFALACVSFSSWGSYAQLPLANGLFGNSLFPIAQPFTTGKRADTPTIARFTGLESGFSRQIDWLKPLKRTVTRPFQTRIIRVPSRERLGYTKSRNFRLRSQVRLGERLFREVRFTTSKGDLLTSCAVCHLTDQDPQGHRVFTDFFNRSWVPFRSEDPRRTEIRNSPTLLDVTLMSRLHLDGEFKSLEELVAGTFSGRPMGWLPGEEEQAFNQVQEVLLADKATEGSTSYREQFKAAFNVELEKLSRDQIIGLVSKAVADFMRTMRSKQDSPYDRFVKLNGLATAPANGESAKAFAVRTLAKLSELESKKALKLGNGFDQKALDGFKVFLRTEGPASVASVGNCVACHAPPLFTDNSFHNLGVSQVEFDRLNGAGTFAQLEIPDAANAKRPSHKFREMVERGRYGVADLGHWNFVDLKTSPLRRAGESQDQLLRRMIGAFKTPTLRHLAYSDPYFHSGDYASLEDVLKEIVRLSEMARAGQLREPDEELKHVKLKEADVGALLAFLATLNDSVNK